MGKFAGAHLVDQGAGDDLLADEVGEALRAIPAIEREAHEQRPRQRSVMQRSTARDSFTMITRSGRHCRNEGGSPVRAIRRENEGSRAPHVVGTPPALTRTTGSDQVSPRHPRETAYRCFLPDLTGFTGPSCAGPSRQRRRVRSRPNDAPPRWGIQPRYSGLRVQGTANAPPSATTLIVPAQVRPRHRRRAHRPAQRQGPASAAPSVSRSRGASRRRPPRNVHRRLA